ncbi:putative endo-xylogalacturonan hydrolase A domain protein [Penicillium digitatum]|uniref:Putative endo-xylogalacturonan hydrolase A domain protein n=1 Tax=Penicillium digitatum TaxID=36651 RepID=A0A7T6XRA9_PENDI|nr:putative endo-xylogalacturonan hydrolase A domain protein [Penicillium digitatum]
MACVQDIHIARSSSCLLCRQAPTPGTTILDLSQNLLVVPECKTQIIDKYEYLPLIKDSDGPISGVFHDGFDPASNYVSEFGVTCSRSCRGGASDLLPIDIRLEPPAVPPGRGSIASTWYMTKASLNGLVKVQVCRNQYQSHHPISGLLLFFTDEHVESLRQAHWDYDLSQEILMPMYVEKGTIGGRAYIKDI